MDLRPGCRSRRLWSSGLWSRGLWSSGLWSSGLWSSGLCLSTFLLGVLTGCRLSVDREEPLAPGRRERLGASVEGRPIVAWVLDARVRDPGGRDERLCDSVEGSARAGPTVLVIGGIHGDEPSGAWLAWVLVRCLDAHPAAFRGRRVVVIPEANPDGLLRGTRRNVRGVDINRNFPARNFRPGRAGGSEAGSEPETEAILEAFGRYDPDLVVALHAPLECVDPDGGPEAMALALAMSRAGGLPLKDLEAYPGSLGSHVSLDLARSAITYELASRSPPSAGGERHLRALLVAIREAGRPAASTLER